MAKDRKPQKPKRRDYPLEWLTLLGHERDLKGDEEGRMRISRAIEALRRDREEREK